MGALTVILAWRGKFELRDPLNLPGFVWLVAGLCAQIALLYGGVGFILGSAVLFALAARAFGQRTLLLNLGVGLVLATVLFMLFRYGLGLSLPAGPLERFIDLLFR
jgi:putative tricarboxylic transport membrane protein